jgi:transposase
VGVDIAKDSFVAALPNAKKYLVKNYPQSGEGYAAFQKALLENQTDPTQVLIVMEATSTYWLNLALALDQFGFKVGVINPTKFHHYALSVGSGAKTDRIDAQLLARYAQKEAVAIWTPPPALYTELNQRVNQRQALLGVQGQLKNQRHALTAGGAVVASVLQRQEALLAQLEAEIKQLDFELNQLAQSASDWSGNLELIRTIPGIGLFTALGLVIATLNFSTCERADQLVRYIGFAPLYQVLKSSV